MDLTSFGNSRDKTKSYIYKLAIRVLSYSNARTMKNVRTMNLYNSRGYSINMYLELNETKNVSIGNIELFRGT